MERANNTGPAISDYWVQYRRLGSIDWSIERFSGSDTEAAIRGLNPNTAYELRVRAANEEGESDWSKATLAKTTPNTSPTFSDGASTKRWLGTATGAGTRTIDPVLATDADGDALIYTLAGPDSDLFMVDPETGDLTSTVAVNLNAASSFEITLRATDPFGDFATITVIIAVRSTKDRRQPPEKPPPTRVPITVVPMAQVTPIPHLAISASVTAIVQPDKPTRIELAQQGVRVSFPAASRDRTFQVRVDTALDQCAELSPPDGVLIRCISVDIYDVEGNPENSVRLIKPAQLTVALDQETIQSLGGLAVVVQSYMLGAIRMVVRERPDTAWSDQWLQFEISPNFEVIIEVDGIRHFSNFALTINRDLLDLASAQVMAVNPSPTDTLSPTPVISTPTATTIATSPQPTITPVPDQTSTRVPPTATAAATVTKSEPTMTPVPDQTSTRVPPTATAIPISSSPKPTMTPIPNPTSTRVPPTVTATPPKQTSTPGRALPDTGGGAAPASVLVILTLAAVVLVLSGLNGIIRRGS